MEFTILQEDLEKSLTIASRFTSQKSQLPILSNILFETKGNKLFISATNLEAYISIPIGAQVKKEGKITIPARVVADLVSSLPRTMISFSLEKEILNIKTNNFNANISGIPANDFPVVDFKNKKELTSIPSNVIKDILVKLLFAVSNDETRPVLTGAYFLFEGKNFEVVATDGFRLSLKKSTLKKNIKNKVNFIIPKNTLLEVLKLSSLVNEVFLSFDQENKEVVFNFDGIILSSRVLEGVFPDYNKIIPKESLISFLTDKEEFLKAIKIASVFAREGGNVVKLKILKNTMEVTAQSSGLGSQKMEVDIKKEKGGDISDFQIAFNFRFLEELLNCLQGDDVHIHFNKGNTPGVFKDSQDENFLHLIMPIKIEE